MITTFWSWFFEGVGGSKSDLRVLISWKLLIHAFVATALLKFMAADPFTFASNALFPAASILVSMAVAWTSRASTVLQDNDFRNKIIENRNPLESYVYGYQLSLFIIIGMVVYVAIMASGGLSVTIIDRDFSIKISGFWLYFLLSLAITQCWEVIDFSNMLSLLHQRVKSGSE